jgi:hypothetical protein
MSVDPDPDRIAALNALYQSERSESASMQTVNAAVVGLAVAYAGATSAFLSQETLRSSDAWVVALLPAPLWIVGVFLATFSSAQARRSYAAIVLERKLTQIAKLTDAEKRIVGLTGLQTVLNVRRAPAIAKLGPAIAFGGELLLAIAYTAYMATAAASMSQAIVTWLLPCLLYVAIFVLTVAISLVHERDLRVLMDQID